MAAVAAGRLIQAMCLYLGSSGRNMSAGSTVWTRPSPPPHAMNMTGRDEKQGGERCMEFEHTQEARSDHFLCNTFCLLWLLKYGQVFKQ